VASIQQVAGNAESTAQSVEEISSSIEEMGKSIQGVAGNAEQLQNPPMKHPKWLKTWRLL